MLELNRLLEKMLMHFGKWNVIRRRPNHASGGKMVRAIAEQTCEMNEAISLYIDTYFLPYYFDKTESISYNLLKGNVGNVAIESLELVWPELEITEDQTLFENCSHYALYQVPYLFLKKEQTSSDTLSYTYHGKKFESLLTDVYIWNVFDEFAAYVGIERFEKESNQSLLNRILFQAQNQTNTSEDGLKNAILSIVSEKNPDATKEDILFSTPDSSTVYKIDAEGEEIFAQLAKINRDTYGYKVWDQDYWLNENQNLQYLPYAYDKEPSEIVSGIGDNQDLQVFDGESTSDLFVTVETYSKELTTITSYLENNPKEVDIALELYKPSDELVVKNSIVKLTANPIINLSEERIAMRYKRYDYIHTSYAAAKILPLDYFAVTPSYDFSPELHYKLQFMLGGPSTPVNIGAKLSDGTNLLTEKGRFVFDEFGENIVHRSTRKVVSQLYHLMYHQGFEKQGDYFALKPESQKGDIEFAINHLQHESMFFDLVSELDVPLPKDYIHFHNYITYADTYQSMRFEDAKLILRFTGNGIRFKVDGSAIVTLEGGPHTEVVIVEDNYFVVEPSYAPKDFVVVITPMNHEYEVKVSDIKYNHYFFDLKLQHGEIINQYGRYILPDYETNNIYIHLESYTRSAPRLSTFYFGELVLETLYETDPFVVPDEVSLILDTNDLVCNLVCIETGEIINHYNDHPHLVATTDIEAQLDLKDFIEIEGIEAPVGCVLKKGPLSYVFQIKQGQQLQSFEIRGTLKKQEVYIMLNDYAHYGTIYASNNYQGFVFYKEDAFTIDMLPAIYWYGLCEIECSSKLECVFKLENGTWYEGTSCSYPFTSFYFKLKDSAEYVAYNNYALLQPEAINIPIEKTFWPFLPESDLIFRVEPVSEGLNVCFYQSDKRFDPDRKYSFLLATLHYQIDFSVDQSLVKEYRKLHHKTYLRSIMPLNYLYETTEDMTLNLAEYMIKPASGFDMIYQHIRIDEMNAHPEFVKSESFYVTSNGFKKLAYCRISDIFYIGFEPYVQGAESSINNIALDGPTGIIAWDDAFYKNNRGRQVYVIYLFEKPIGIRVSLNELYSQCQTTKEVYKLIDSATFIIPKTERYFDLKHYDPYKQADRVWIYANEPGYRIEKEEQGISILPIFEEPKICIKKGYYYKDNKEYFLFADYQTTKLTRNPFVLAKYTAETNKGIQLQPESINFVKNSAMHQTEDAVCYYNDFITSKEVETLNLLGRLNVCEQLNRWITYDATLSLVKTNYNKGIAFHTNAYGKVIFPIPELEDGLYTLSFHSPQAVSAKLGIKLRTEEHSEHFMLLTEMVPLIKEGDCYYATFDSKDCYVYLVLSGDGIIDDMVLKKGEFDAQVHIKNPKTIKLPQAIAYQAGQKIRLSFKDQFNYSGTLYLDNEGTMLPKTSISWDETPLFNLGESTSFLFPDVEIRDNAYVANKETVLEFPISEIPHFENVAAIKISFNTFDNTPMPFILRNGFNPQALSSTQSGDKQLIVPVSQLTGPYIQLWLSLNKDAILYEAYVNVVYKEGVQGGVTYPDNLYLYSDWFDLGALETYKLSHLVWSHYSNQTVKIRSAKNILIDESFSVVEMTKEGHLIEPIDLGTCRYVQFFVQSSYLEDACNIKYFDVEVTPNV